MYRKKNGGWKANTVAARSNGRTARRRNETLRFFSLLLLWLNDRLFDDPRPFGGLFRYELAELRRAHIFRLGVARGKVRGEK